MLKVSQVWFLVFTTTNSDERTAFTFLLFDEIVGKITALLGKAFYCFPLLISLSLISEEYVLPY